MNVPPAVIELFLRTAKAPPAVIDLFKLFQAEGFSAFAFKPVAPDDPNWTAINADPEKTHTGIWLRATGPNSRITAAIFLEGVNDEVLSKIQSLGAADPGVRQLATGV